MSALSRSRVDPIGHVDSVCTAGRARLPVYPPETVAIGHRIREMRIALGLGLRDAAGRAGLQAVRLSSIERGAVRLWYVERAVEALRAAWSCCDEQPVCTGRAARGACTCVGCGDVEGDYRDDTARESERQRASARR